MVVFPYWEEVRNNEVKLLPLVPVKLSSDAVPDDKTSTAMALVNSGAEHNIFSLAAADDIGLNLSDQNDVTIIGAGGKHTPGKAAVAIFELAHYRWTVPIIFSAAVNERPLLGQAGFFRFFTVTFRYERRDMEIKQNRTPRTSTWAD